MLILLLLVIANARECCVESRECRISLLHNDDGGVNRFIYPINNISARQLWLEKCDEFDSPCDVPCFVYGNTITRLCPDACDGERVMVGVILALAVLLVLTWTAFCDNLGIRF